MYFSPEQARAYVQISRVVAEYIPGVGARCTLCGEWGNPLNKGGYQTLAAGQRRKYFVCPTCGNKFPANLSSNIADLR